MANWLTGGFDAPAFTIRNERTDTVGSNLDRTLANTQDQGASGLAGLALDILPFGRVIEKAATGRAGDIGAGEVALEGALTLLPFGRLAKGAKAGVKAIAGRGGTEVAQQTATRTAPRLTRAGERFGRTSTVAPKSKLSTASQQRDLVQQAQGTAALRGSGTRKFQNVDKEINRLSSEVDKTLKGVKTTMPGTTFQRSVAEIGDSITDPLEQKAFARIYNNAYKKVFSNDALPEAVTPLKINSLRREINKQAGSVFNKVQRGTPLTSQDQAILTLRDNLGDMIGGLTPKRLQGAVQNLNREMSTLLGGRAEFKALSEQAFAPMGMNLPGVSTLVPQATQAASDYLGRGLTQLGGSSLPARATRQAAGQAGRRTVADATGIRPALAGGGEAAPTDLESALATTGGTTGFPGQTGMDTFGAGTQDTFGQQATSPFGISSQEIGQGLMQALMAGDMEAAQQLQTMYELASEFEATAAPPEVDEGVQQSMNTLDVLEDLYNQAGGGAGRVGGLFERAQGALGLDDARQAYEDNRMAAATMIARAFGETRPTDEDVIRILKSMPSAMSTPGEAQIKFRSLRTLLSKGNQGVGLDDALSILQEEGVR